MTAQPQENQAQVSQNDSELNMAKMRKQLEQERSARQQAEERAAQYEKERAMSARKPYKEDDDEPISDEPYVDHRSLDKKFKKWEANIDEKIDKRAEEKARMMVEQERQTSYLKQNSDFNEVMRPEMMQKLVEKDPDLAETILQMPEGFARQKLVYQSIKAMGLHKKEEPKSSIQQTIEQNRKSPYYQPSQMGSSPYAAVGDFSDAGQKNAYSKMKELQKKLRI